MGHRVLDDWQTIESLLPANWEQLAQVHKQLEIKHGNAKITNARDLLRLILVHAACDLPLRQTVALVAEAGGPTLSPMRLHKKMIRAGSYLHALVTAVVESPMGSCPEKWGGYEVSVVDASIISRPGSAYGDGRLHLRMRLSDLKYLQVRCTGVDEGETLRRFDFAPGELVVADRGYSQARGIAHVLDCGADVLVRLNRVSMPTFWPCTEVPFDIMSALRALPRDVPREQDVVVRHSVAGHVRTIHGRLCMVRLPEREAQRARKRLRRRLQKSGIQLNADTLEAAGYVVLFTTTSNERLSAAQCVELYRLRWQVELQIKRWKSICGFDRMPNFRDDTIVSWLYAKMLAAVLLEKLASLHSEVFPPIDWEEEREQEPDVIRPPAVEADAATVAIARVGALAGSALRSAAQSCSHH
jgi:Transposase DDE domain